MSRGIQGPVALLVRGSKNQFLYPPVQQLGHVKFIQGRTCDFVNPSELLQLFAGFSQNSENSSVKSQLIDSPGVGIGNIQHLVGSWRDADGPRRSWGHRLSTFDRQNRFVANSRTRVRIEWHINSD